LLHNLQKIDIFYVKLHKAQISFVYVMIYLGVFFLDVELGVAPTTPSSFSRPERNLDLGPEKFRTLILPLP